MQMFQNINLSRMTIQRRVVNIRVAAKLMDQFKQKVKEFCFYSLAMDESIDCCDTAQPVMYIRGVDKNFNISEELAMQSMKGLTTGKDICTELINCVNKKLAYNFTNLVAICIEGAPAMSGKHTGAVSLIQEVIERGIITHRYIIHQPSFCGKILKFDHIMWVVVSVVNYLHTLKHRTFRAFLEEVDTEYKYLLYHTEVRWLSQGRVQFIKNEPKTFEELENESWSHDLFFLYDIATHLNNLKLQLQRKNLLIIQLVGHFKSRESF